MLQHILHHHSCTSCSNSDTHTQQATHVLLCTGLEQVSARPAWVATKTGETLCCSIFCIITPVHHAPTVAQCFFMLESPLLYVMPSFYTLTQQATHVLLCTGLEQVSARPAWVATKTGETLCCSIFCIITPVHHAPTLTLIHSRQTMCYCAQALNRCQPDLPGLQQKQVRHCVAAYFASSLLYIMLQL